MNPLSHFFSKLRSKLRGVSNGEVKNEEWNVANTWINNIAKLKVGQFAWVNSNLVYRVKLYDSGYSWMEGLFIIEKHGHLPIWDHRKPIEIVSKPEKKHVDNAIKQVRESYFERREIDNLTLVENLSILKGYLKSDIIEEGK